MQCKVFTATMARERAGLGEDFNAWYRELGEPVIIDKHILQSSDSTHHCLSIVVFYEAK